MRNMCKEAVKYIRSNNETYDLNNVSDAAALILDSYNNSRNSCFEKSGKEVKVVKIAKDMGFSLFAQELPNHIGGYIVIDENIKEKFGTDKIIVVNENASANRKRFTIAHEIGHYLLSFKNAPNVSDFSEVTTIKALFEDDETSNQQSEALVNRFAAELLMPSEIFSKEFEKMKNDKPVDYYDVATELSKIFNVPIRAASRRIAELNLK